MLLGRGQEKYKIFVHARENLLTENLREIIKIKIRIMMMV